MMARRAVAQKYSPNDVSIVFVQEPKKTLSGHMEKPTEWPTVWQRTLINQEERRRYKTPAHTINVRSLTASVRELQVVDITPVLYSLIAKSRLVRSINRNMMLLKQFLPAIRQISSEFVIFQLDSGPAHMGLEAINFHP